MLDCASSPVADNVEGRERQAVADREGSATGPQADACDGERPGWLFYRVHVRVAVKVAPTEALVRQQPFAL